MISKREQSALLINASYRSPDKEFLLIQTEAGEALSSLSGGSTCPEIRGWLTHVYKLLLLGHHSRLIVQIKCSSPILIPVDIYVTCVLWRRESDLSALSQPEGEKPPPPRIFRILKQSQGKWTPGENFIWSTKCFPPRQNPQATGLREHFCWKTEINGNKFLCYY